MVAPVLGETNLFIQSCCIIKPETLIPTPVHKIASNLGILESRNIFSSIPSPTDSNVFKSISITPVNKDNMDRIKSEVPRIIVDKCFFVISNSPFFWLVLTNHYFKIKFTARRTIVIIDVFFNKTTPKLFYFCSKKISYYSKKQLYSKRKQEHQKCSC